MAMGASETVVAECQTWQRAKAKFKGCGCIVAVIVVAVVASAPYRQMATVARQPRTQAAQSGARRGRRAPKPRSGPRHRTPSPEKVPMFAQDPEARARRRELIGNGGSAIQLLIGDAIGDAFGAIIEMQDAYWIRRSVSFDRWPKNPMRRTEWNTNTACGMYTDDCEMTVGLVNGLLAHGLQLGEEEMLKAWQAEWDLAKKRPRPAPPGAERNGHGSIKTYFRGFREIDEVRRLQASKEDPGNAPPMRALPLAYVRDAKIRERLCILNANATHPHPRARAASFLMAEGARWLIVEEGDQKEVISVSLQRLQHSNARDAATEAHLAKLDALEDYHDWGDRFNKMPASTHEILCGPQPCPPADGIGAGDDGSSKMHGLWSDAMRTSGLVLYLLKHHRGPLDILRASVDIGGDVDSIAALCLGVVGGSAGLGFGEANGLPWFLLEEVEGVEYLHAKGQRFQDWILKQTQAESTDAR